MAAEYVYCSMTLHFCFYSHDSQSKKMDFYDSQSHATKLPKGHKILLWHIMWEIVR